MQRWMMVVLIAAVFVAGVFPGSAFAATPPTGWWWRGEDPAGTWVSIEGQGEDVYLAWYGYDESGRAVWYSSLMRRSGAAFVGELLRYEGGALSANVPGADCTSTSMSNATLTFAVNGTELLVNGTETIPLQRYWNGTHDSRDINGWWHDPQFNGMGLYVEAVDGRLFATWSHFRDDGSPRWWSAVGDFSQDSVSFSQELQEYSHGRTLTRPWSEPVAAGDKGTVELDFSSDGSCTMSWNGRSYDLKRYVFSQADPVPPVYVTFMGHIEDQERFTDCADYPGFREKLLRFGEFFYETGAALNLQVDYPFFEGTMKCEDEAMRSETDGRNIIDYLAVEYGVEFDPHRSGGWDWIGTVNYADVRYIGGQLTSHMSEIVGGVVWDFPDQLQEFIAGQQGRKHPSFTWTPEGMTAGAAYDHHFGDLSKDEISSGVWVPAGHDDAFSVHDVNGTVAYIGSGPLNNWSDSADCEFRNTVDYVEVLTEYLHQGKVEPHIFTATISLPQGVIFNEPEEAKKLTDQLQPLIDQGLAQHATYSEILDIWRTRFAAQGHRYPFEAVDEEDYTCD